MRALLPALLLASLVPSRSGAAEVTRVDEPPMEQDSARKAWDSPGFRLHLQFGWADVIRTSNNVSYQTLPAPGRATPGTVPITIPVGYPTPEGTGFTFALRPGARIDENLELTAGLRYQLFSPHRLQDGVNTGGARFGLTADASWYFTRGIYAGIGAGYGGLLATGGCRADGPEGLVRVGGLAVIGDLFAMGPVLELDVSRVSCNQNNTQLSWTHHSVSLSWSLSWR